MSTSGKTVLLPDNVGLKSRAEGGLPVYGWTTDRAICVLGIVEEWVSVSIPSCTQSMRH